MPTLFAQPAWARLKQMAMGPWVPRSSQDIMNSSRTRHITGVFRRIHTRRSRPYRAPVRIREDQLTYEERRLEDELATRGNARKTMSFPAPRCASTGPSGYEDTERTLKHEKWMSMPSCGADIVFTISVVRRIEHRMPAECFLSGVSIAQHAHESDFPLRPNFFMSYTCDRGVGEWPRDGGPHLCGALGASVVSTGRGSLGCCA